MPVPRICCNSVAMLSKAQPTRQAKVCSAATVANAIKLRARRYSTSPWPRTSPLSSRERRIFNAMGDAGLLFGPFQSSVAEVFTLLVCSLSLFPFKSNSNSLCFLALRRFTLSLRLKIVFVSSCNTNLKILAKQAPLTFEQQNYQNLREQVLRRDGWRCRVCGSMANLEVHQKQFRSHCGNHDKRNLITLCFDCHGLIHGKSTRSGSVLTVRCWPGLGKYLKGYHTRSTHLVRCTRTAPSYSS